MQQTTALREYFAKPENSSRPDPDVDEKVSESLNLAIGECSFQIRSAETLGDQLAALRKLGAAPCSEDETPKKIRALLKYSKRHLGDCWKIFVAGILINVCEDAFGDGRLWF